MIDLDRDANLDMAAPSNVPLGRLRMGTSVCRIGQDTPEAHPKASFSRSQDL